MAKQIALAIIKYKKEYFNETFTAEEITFVESNIITNQQLENVIISQENNQSLENKDGLYKVQLFASSKKREMNSTDFKGLKNISFTLEKNLYKYFYGNTNDFNEAKKMYQEAINHNFKDAFIVTFADGKSSAIK
jgi:N-acetylmuramoyl-L-alanine amidase